jgi:hypothetical protein
MFGIACWVGLLGPCTCEELLFVIWSIWMHCSGPIVGVVSTKQPLITVSLLT